MFERVITQTIQRISSEVLRDRQSVPLAEILDDERVPTRFKPFFATEVRWWLHNDVVARNANKRFDFAHQELASLLEYLEQVMFRHARFDQDEFRATLDGAVKLTFNYLCRPQTTLKWYIFRGQPVKPLSEVMLRFESFLDYEYIGNVFAEWVERKVQERSTFEAISATEFERIIRRIDDQILLSCTVDELLALLDPIFDFIGEGAEQTVPLDALIIFFDDKNVTRLVEHLDRYRAPNLMISRERFVGILDELLTTAEENPEADFSSVYQNDELDDIVRSHLQSAPDDRETRDDNQNAVAEPVAEKAAAFAEPVADTATAFVDDDAVRARAQSADDDAMRPRAHTAPAVDDAASIDDVVATFEMPRGALSDPAPLIQEAPPIAHDSRSIASEEKAIDDKSQPVVEAPGPSVEETHPTVDKATKPDVDDVVKLAGDSAGLDPLLERKVLKKIFDRDRAAYDETMLQLQSAESWRQASLILDELFIRFDVDPYSRTALRFTDSVYTRFARKSNT